MDAALGTTRGASQGVNTGPDYYQIRVQGHLAPRWTQWLGRLGLQHEPDGTTLLSGRVADQAALHGVLNLIHCLGLVLISVNRLAPDNPPPEVEPPGVNRDGSDTPNR